VGDRVDMVAELADELGLRLVAAGSDDRLRRDQQAAAASAAASVLVMMPDQRRPAPDPADLATNAAYLTPAR